MKTVFATILAVVVLQGCGDRGWYTASTDVEVTRKGCATKSTSTNSIFINVVSERLPNGQMKCTIETLAEAPDQK